MEDKACTTCLYWVDNSCRRYPPTATVIIVPARSVSGFEAVPYSSLPSTTPDHWCGEWIKKSALSLN